MRRVQKQLSVLAHGAVWYATVCTNSRLLRASTINDQSEQIPPIKVEIRYGIKGEIGAASARI